MLVLANWGGGSGIAKLFPTLADVFGSLGYKDCRFLILGRGFRVNRPLPGADHILFVREPADAAVKSPEVNQDLLKKSVGQVPGCFMIVLLFVVAKFFPLTYRSLTVLSAGPRV